MENPHILCDSSSLISLTDSCLDGIIPFFHSKFNVQFVIPPSVEFETVTRPISSDLKPYAFSAIKIKKMIEDGVIKKIEPSSQSKTALILQISNNMLYTKGRPLNLVHKGESEMLALAEEMGVSNV